MAEHNKTNIIKHLLKLDHAAFLLMLPAILLGYKYVAIELWLIALIYDIYEQKTGKE